jgi:hypothetical protein
VFVTFYTVNALFFTLLHYISLLFLHETVTIAADGMSCSLLDLGLGVTNFYESCHQ